MEGGDDSAAINELDVEGCVGPSEMKEYCNNPSCERKLFVFCFIPPFKTLSYRNESEMGIKFCL